MICACCASECRSNSPKVTCCPTCKKSGVFCADCYGWACRRCARVRTGAAVRPAAPAKPVPRPLEVLESPTPVSQTKGDRRASQARAQAQRRERRAAESKEYFDTLDATWRTTTGKILARREKLMGFASLSYEEIWKTVREIEESLVIIKTIRAAYNRRNRQPPTPFE